MTKEELRENVEQFARNDMFSWTRICFTQLNNKLRWLDSIAADDEVGLELFYSYSYAMGKDDFLPTAPIEDIRKLMLHFGGRWEKKAKNSRVTYTRTEAWNNIKIVLTTYDAPPQCKWVEKEETITIKTKVLKCHDNAPTSDQPSTSDSGNVASKASE